MLRRSEGGWLGGCAGCVGGVGYGRHNALAVSAWIAVDSVAIGTSAVSSACSYHIGRAFLSIPSVVVRFGA